jgi:hypothetical protein
MKSIAIIVVLVIVGAAGAFGYIKWRSSQQATQPTPPAAGSEARDRAAGDQHGQEISAAAGGVLCAKHRIPESKDAFCHPELVEELGFCGGHDVPEAFCTRCSPILIAAFKAEGDWCDEHGLPESQCAICKKG